MLSETTGSNNITEHSINRLIEIALHILAFEKKPTGRGHVMINYTTYPISTISGIFSNSLIIHQVKTKKITTVTEVGYPILISIDFDDFTSPFTP